MAFNRRATFALFLASAPLLLALLSGCGRKATEADCELILDRSVELQMKELDKREPSAIQKRQEVLRKELEGEMKDCVGRRVTDKMIGCVRSAATSADLEKCVN